MRKICQVHQIEMTSRCNLRCVYCPSRSLPRPKVDMTEEDYRRALSWVRLFVQRNMQHSVNLAGIGESTIHLDFVRFVNLAREYVGWGCDIVLATNGVALTEEMVRGIVAARPSMFVSLHRPEKAGPAIELLKRYGLLRGTSSDPSEAAINWAGQVNWFVSVPQRRQCEWLAAGMVMVMADGRVTRCPMDTTGVGVICHINDDIESFKTSPYSLCATCDQIVPEAMRIVGG